ncbi:MAG: UDP-2,3-diacylglucosamine diphosphatase [Gemmatimonadota bacterium]|nr:MAG: UDP-2,3-diacylglucosamine diphosphatase [Gemmatimonadota bacterium]
MKSDIYFISDAHLGGDSADIEREKEERLDSFLDHVREKAEVLYVVGDLFDLWFEYRKTVPNCYFRILKKLSDVKEAGTRIVFITGNHDVWIGPYLIQEIGLDVRQGSFETQHQGLSFFISHGDGMIGRERSYRLQRWIMRNSVCIWLYKLLHPDLGLPLARWVSRWSRNKSKSKRPGWNNQAYREAAMKKLEEGYDVVVLAHIHFPALEEKDGKLYLNTGDWINHFSYGRLRGGRLTLEKWARSSHKEGS